MIGNVVQLPSVYGINIFEALYLFDTVEMRQDLGRCILLKIETVLNFISSVFEIYPPSELVGRLDLHVLV